MVKRILSPFRWAGSKAKLTSELFDKFKEADIYVEPFLGSGVVLFRLIQENRYKRYIVNDINVSIISFYKAIQKNVDLVIQGLNSMSDSYNKSNDKEALYYRVRTAFNQDKSNFFLFWLLMKAGFNGLYRENKKGHYNAPFGKKEKIKFDEEMILEIHKLIQNVEFYNMDYKDFYNMLNDDGSKFCYNDPPYCNSQKYTAKGFDNYELADFLDTTKDFIAISDVDNEFSREVYGKFEQLFIKEQKRVINIKNITTKSEVLYVNY